MEQDIAQNELYAALKVCKKQRNIHRKHTFRCIRVALEADTELADSAQILEFATAKHDKAIQRVSDTKSLCESAHKAAKIYESEYKAAKLKWKQRKRFTLFQADGNSEISWVAFELIFAHIWDPVNRRCTFTSERFQRTCRGFRKATQSYLKDHPFYPIHFRPGKCTQGVSGQICRWINGYVVLKLWEYDTEERKGFHERRLNLGKSEKFVTVVYETTDDPPNLVVVIQRWPDDTASMPTLMLGGKYKQNEHGNICDLGCMPTTELAPFVWPPGLEEYDVMALQSTASVQDDGCVLYTRNYDKQYHIDYRATAKIDTSVPCFILQNI